MHYILHLLTEELTKSMASQAKKAKDRLSRQPYPGVFMRKPDFFKITQDMADYVLYVDLYSNHDLQTLYTPFPENCIYFLDQS